MVGNITFRNNEGNETTTDYSSWFSVFNPQGFYFTEEKFIQLLEKGIYSSEYIGTVVKINNSVANDYSGKYIIADVNHDGETNSYDLINLTSIGQNAVHDYSSKDNYRITPLRSWLNSTFYNGFSPELRNHMINLKYEYFNISSSTSSIYNDDKITLLSLTEVGIDRYNKEGTRYPLFTDDNSRIKINPNTQESFEWSLRSTTTSSYGMCTCTVGTRGWANTGRMYNFICETVVVFRVR